MNAKDWAEYGERAVELEAVLRNNGQTERAERVNACLQRVEALERAVRLLHKVGRSYGCEPGSKTYNPGLCRLCAAIDDTAALVEE